MTHPSAATADQLSLPFMATPFEIMTDVYCLPAWLPVPGAGLLAVNAFLLMGEEPILVDTGLGMLQDSFMAALRTLVDPADIRWIWLSHTDADHIGNLDAVLAAAPQAQLVTSFLGQGKLGMMGKLPSNVTLIEDGGVLETRDRGLRAIRPPYYDAPETLGFADMDGGPLFCGDAFGALLTHNVVRLEAVAPDQLSAGLIAWAAIDAPWLALAGHSRFEKVLDALISRAPKALLSGHLPPADGRELPRLTTLALEAQAACGAG